MNYQFANIKEENNRDVVTYSNGNVNDYTVFKNRQLGDFVHYINNEVLKNKHHINKPFFYDLIGIEFIDPVFVIEKSISHFKKLMAHCISISNVFENKNVRINKCIYNYNDRTVYKYGVIYNGKEDIWVMKNIDGKKNFFSKNGRKIFKSDMFSKKSIEAWETVVDKFFFYQMKIVSSNIIQRKEYYCNSYQFAYTKNIDNGIVVFPNGTVNDDTIIREMEIGVFLNFVNTVVLENDNKINKQLFFDLISVEILDPNIANIDSVQTFNKKIAYCLAISKAFGNDDIRINNGIFEYNYYNLHKYIITRNGSKDMWIMDGGNDRFYIGNSEYVTFPYKNGNNGIENVSILDPIKSISMWIFVVDTFYNSPVKTLEHIVSSNSRCRRESKHYLKTEHDSVSNPKPKSKSKNRSKSNPKHLISPACCCSIM